MRCKGCNLEAVAATAAVEEEEEEEEETEGGEAEKVWDRGFPLQRHSASGTSRRPSGEVRLEHFL